MMGQEYLEIIDTETLSQFHLTVRSIIEALIKPGCLKRSIFIALLLIIMDENDFQLLNGAIASSINIVAYMVSQKDINKDIHEAMFVLNGFEGLPLKIIAAPLSEEILVIATLPDLCKETYSICFNINKYISTSPLGIPLDITNVDNLKTKFRENIVFPIKCSILDYYKLANPSLRGLPTDVVNRILIQMSPRDVLSMSETCTRLNSITKEEGLWCRLCKRDFGANSNAGDSWRDTYIKLYLEREEEIQKLSNIIFKEYYCEYLDCVRQCVDPRWELIL